MRSSRTLWILLLAITPWLLGPVAAQGGERPDPGARRRPPKIPLTYGVIPLGDRTITVDGKVDEWPKLRYLPLHWPFQVSGGAGYRGGNDLRGLLFACWSPDTLYLAIQIQDDFHRPPSQLAGRGYNPGGPVGDGVYLRFDPRRDTRSLGRTPERKEDREYWVSVLEKGAAYALALDRLAGRIVKTDEIRVAVKVTPPANKKLPFVYTYEVAVPWKAILPEEMKPAPKMTLGFDPVLEDFDSPVDTLPQTRIGWTFAEGDTLYPGNEGTLVLLEKPLPNKVRLDPIPRPVPERAVHLGVEDVVFYEELDRELRASTPAAGMPGTKRLALLQRIDERLGAWPALDTGLMVTRWQRFMNREFKGIMDRGVPSFFRARCKVALDAFGEKIKAADRVTLVRLPRSGWLIRSQYFTFAVDPFLPGLHRYGPKVDAQFLTNAVDPLRRDDPLSVQTRAANLPLLAHVPVIIPRFDSASIQYIRPGDGVNLGAAEVLVAGPLPPKPKKGEKPAPMARPEQVGYDIRFLPAGPRLVFGGHLFDASWVTEKGKAGKLPVDVVALPLDHPRLAKVLAELKPRLFLPQDVLDMPVDPTGRTDLRLQGVLERLQALKGVKWHLLAWGERLPVVAGGRGEGKKQD